MNALTWLRGRLQSTDITLFGHLDGLSSPGPRRPIPLPYWIRRPMRSLERFLAGKQWCPRRAGGGAGSFFPGPDYWQVHYNGDRVCSYCGSLDPKQFLAICRQIVLDGDTSRASIEFCKGYKFYVTRPGIRNASEGAIKFYTPHFTDDDRAIASTINKVIDEARRISHAAWSARFMQKEA